MGFVYPKTGAHRQCQADSACQETTAINADNFSCKALGS